MYPRRDFDDFLKKKIGTVSSEKSRTMKEVDNFEKYFFDMVKTLIP